MFPGNSANLAAIVGLSRVSFLIVKSSALSDVHVLRAHFGQLGLVFHRVQSRIAEHHGGVARGSQVTLVVDNSVAMRCGVAIAGNLAD
jgi:hypothetical protein